jgi:8-oxo-dGTP pyrophosphatase MutT (NUDIX family)
MGGSILPVTILNNQVYFLFGKEREIDENPGWSDFGGGTDKGETLFQTAIREGSEELTGFLGDPQDIKKLLNKYGTFNIDFKSQGHTTYRCHIFPMVYDDKLTYYYNNNQRFLQKKLDPKIIRDSKIFEKTQIKWFSFEEIKKNHNEFRSFYQNIVDLIMENKNGIENFVRKSLKASHIKTNKNRNRNRNIKSSLNKTIKNKTYKNK